MRLIPTQVEMINEQVDRCFGDKCSTYLFGSRLNDDLRGGDVDLLVETEETVPFIARARLKAALERKLQLPVDIVFACGETQSSFVSIIRKQAVRL